MKLAFVFLAALCSLLLFVVEIRTQVQVNNVTIKRSLLVYMHEMCTFLLRIFHKSSLGTCSILRFFVFFRRVL